MNNKQIRELDMGKLMTVLMLLAILLVGCNHPPAIAPTPTPTPLIVHRTAYVAIYFEPSVTTIPTWSPDFSPMTCIKAVSYYGMFSSYEEVEKNSTWTNNYQISGNYTYLYPDSKPVTYIFTPIYTYHYWDYQARQWVQGNESDKALWEAKYWELFK